MQDTISVLRADAGAYDPEVLDALVRCHAVEEADSPPREVGVDDLRGGTEALIHRLENYAGLEEVSRSIRVKG